jgi:hypothetical protein
MREFKPFWGEIALEMWGGTISFAGFMLNVPSSVYLHYPFKNSIWEEKNSTPGIEISGIGKCTP